MNAKYFTFLLLLGVVFSGFSQKAKDVLLTLDEKPIYNSEFKKVYNKNLDLVIDDSQKDVDSYLELFIDYKLKVAEAYAQGLDKEESFKKEFAKYQDQLSKNYIYDKRVTSELVDEAYQRGLEEIDVDHILIMVNLNAPPQDTLVAYNKIKEVRKKALAGEDFVELAKKYSEEPGVKKTGGQIGYFTVFQMLYSFENEAYKTKVGEISEIVRTDFGYHIIRVNDRREMKPKINVSHIMIFSNKDAKEKNPKEKIDELYAMIMQGESFESIAKQFSEDKATGMKGGVIKTFGPGNLKAPLFEKAAYSIENEGDILAPIESSFGWHIIRLNKVYPIPSYEESEEDIEKKVKSGARIHVITQSTNKKIMDKYGYKEGVSYDPYFSTYLTDSIYKRKWKYSEIPSKEDQTLFTIGDKELKYNDFALFIEKKQAKMKIYGGNMTSILIDIYQQFKNEEIENYFKFKLEEENEEYADVLNEYRNGLLIFDVMYKNVWEKAKNDSIALLEHYEKTKQNYVWKQRVDADIFSSPKISDAQLIKNLLEEGKDNEAIKEQLNTNGKVNVIVTKGVYEIDEKEIPSNYIPVVGVSDIYTTEESNVVVNTNNLLEPSIKEYNDVKGKIVSDYQTQLEEEWMDELREKYQVKVNNKALKKVKKDLNN